MNRILLLTLFILLGFTLRISAQVTADFSVDDSTSCQSYVAQFTNSSSGSGTLSYKWDFGNGITSTLKNPQVVYNQPGSYNVKLIVSNGAESDTLEKKNYIRVFVSPKASFSADKTRGCMPLEVNFTLSVIEGSAPVTNYIWDFGDGQLADSSNARHIFTQAGKYDISLFVKDSNGCDVNLMKSDFIEAVAIPKATFEATNNESCLDTLTVQFVNKSTGSSTLSYSWSFGDGKTSSQESPNHFYNQFGEYLVSLIVRDADACADTLTRDKLVKLLELEVHFSLADDSVCTSQQLEITNNSLIADKFSWSFGDGTISEEKVPKKLYSSGGKYQIVLAGAYKNLCFDTLRTQLYVDSVVAGFSTDVQYGCELPLVVNYTGAGINVSQYKWFFGNGTSSTEVNPVVTYKLSDEIKKTYQKVFKDSLIVYSSIGCTDTLVVDSSVVVILPKIYFTPNDSSFYSAKTSGCIPIGLTFEDKSYSMNPTETLISRVWDFGDGTTSESIKVAKSYEKHGDYEVSLTVTNSAGCVNQFISHIYAGSPQTALFEYTGSDSVCGTESVSLFNLSTVDSLIDRYEWKFGDSLTSNQQNPKHSFIDTGFMSAQLKVMYNGCEGSIFKVDSLVYVKGPAGVAFATYDCAKPYEYTFSVELKDADRFYWNFGDNSYDSTQATTVTHNYITGTYKAIVEAYNDKTNCVFTKEINAIPRHLKAIIETSGKVICKGESISLNPLSSVDVNPFLHQGQVQKYLWTISDTLQFFTDGPLEIAFDTVATFKVNLMVRDVKFCPHDTTIIIKTIQPIAAYSLNDSIGCVPFNVNFTNASISDTTITSFEWKFGTAYTSINENPEIDFTNPGKYDVSLIVKDAVGCTDTITAVKQIYASGPTPKLSFSQTKLCRYATVNVKNLSVGGGLTAKWDFGDGNTSEVFSPTHQYIDTGYFHVSVYLTDTLGCDTTFIAPDSIYVQPLPDVDFSSDKTSSVCYPALVEFANQTKHNDMAKFKWDFGDGTPASSYVNPPHTFFKPGNYSISLSVTTSLGCADTLIREKYINIQGPWANIVIADSACINIPIPIAFKDTINVYSFRWVFSDGDGSNLPNPEKVFEDFGKHKVYLNLESDVLGSCQKLFEDSVYIPLLASAFSLSDSDGCVPFLFTAQNLSQGESILDWTISDGAIFTESTWEHTCTNPGTEIVKLIVENNIGCRDSSEIPVVIYPLPTISINPGDTLICYGDTIEVTAKGGVAYEWFNNGELIFQQPTVKLSPKNNTSYSIQVVDTNQCVNNDSVMVKVQQIPQVIINESDTILVIGESLYLNCDTTFASDIHWFPETGLNSSVAASVLASPRNTINYYAVVNDPNNCFIVRDSVTITIDKKYSVDFPKAFTPNYDGVNDEAFVKGWGIKQLLKFEIVDRYGKTVFASSDLANGWNGIYDNADLPQDAYYYYIEVRYFDDSTEEKKGVIFLMR